jgi:SAM-dependent methyltransferase
VTKEWIDWHRNYEDDPSMAGRLRAVQTRIRSELDRSPPGPIRILSACSGDGRDLLGVLEDHPRAVDVRARLVDVSPELVAAGRGRALERGWPGVEFVEGDAGVTTAFAGATPAHLLLLCGIFGNITDADVRNTVAHAPELCAANATVIWTRGRFPPDLTPTIRRWFAENGFAEESFETIEGTTKSVGVHRLTAPPRPFREGVRLFAFLPTDQRPSNRPGVRSESTPSAERTDRPIPSG